MKVVVGKICELHLELRLLLERERDVRGKALGLCLVNDRLRPGLQIHLNGESDFSLREPRFSINFGRRALGSFSAASKPKLAIYCENNQSMRRSVSFEQNRKLRYPCATLMFNQLINAHRKALNGIYVFHLLLYLR